MNGKLIALLLAVAAAESGSAVTYEEEIPVFRCRQDGYSPRNGARVSWNDKGEYEIAMTNRNMWMEFSAFPGARPVRGAEEYVLETDVAYPGVVELHFREFPNGKTTVLKRPWATETRFPANLDPAKKYQFTTFVAYRSDFDGKPWRFAIRRLRGRFTTSEAEALRIDCRTGNPLYLVREGRKEKAALTVSNLAPQTVECKLRLEMTGPFGERQEIVEFRKLGARAEAVIALPQVATKGVWRLKGTVAAGDGSSAPVETRFAVIDSHDITPKQPYGTFRMGVNYHMGRFSEKDRRLTTAALVACGAKLARADVGTFMATVQPTGPDDERFEAADSMVGMLEKAGLAINAHLQWNPKWAARPEALAKNDWRLWATGRIRDGLYENFCEKVARHFGTRIDYYEIGNEWDLGFPGPAEDAIAIQREAYVGIKRGCPKACVISNGWAAPDDNNQVVRSGHKGFREAVLKDAAQYIDVLPIHIHGSLARYIKDIEGEFFPLRKRTGLDRKPWYSNETSQTSVWEERGPALLVWKKILYAWSAGSQDYIWYNLKGTGWDPKDPEQGYGMLTADYRPRETFVAFAALATAFGGKTFDRTVFRAASRFVLAFRGNDGLTLGAWDESSTPDGVKVSVRTDAKSAVRIDFFGNRTVLPIRNGQVEFVFGSHPAALVLAGANFADPDKEALADIPPPNAKAIEIPSPAFGRPCDFELATPAQVTDFWEANPTEMARLWKGPEDLSAKVWVGHDDRCLKVRIEVTDDVQALPRPGDLQWEGDDVQVAFASHLQSGHWEFGLGRRDDGASDVVCWLAPVGMDGAAAAKSVILKTERKGSVTTYEASFPYEAIGFSEKLMRQGFRFNVMLNDNDGTARDAAIEIIRGNFGSKDAGLYPFVRFAK